MSLSISVYKNIERTENTDDYRFTAFVEQEIFNKRIQHLEVGKGYKGEPCNCGILYSYSAHHKFKIILLKIIGREDLLLSPDRIDWLSLQDDTELPFYEFLFLNDNEGCIDWCTNSILYQNFKEWEKQALQVLKDKEYSKNNYLTWLNIFLHGKETNSVVVFS